VEALSSNPSTAKRKKKNERKQFLEMSVHALRFSKEGQSIIG
jgi:hypothetical protein